MYVLYNILVYIMYIALSSMVMFLNINFGVYVLVDCHRTLVFYIVYKMAKGKCALFYDQKVLLVAFTSSWCIKALYFCLILLLHK